MDDERRSRQRRAGRRHAASDVEPPCSEYLATRESPLAFRVFLLRHGDLLPCIQEWTIRVLLPRRLRKAAALYRYAGRDAFMNRLLPSDTEEMDFA